MRAFLRIGVLSLLLILFSSPVLAQSGDVLSPTRLSYQVEPGESFSFDLSFYSRRGGEHTIYASSFEYDENYNVRYVDGPQGMVTFPDETFSLEPGQERYIPVQVTVPESIREQDEYVALFVRPEDGRLEGPSYEIATMLYLSGRDSQAAVSARIAKAEFRSDSDDESLASALSFELETDEERYVALSPRLVFLDEAGAELKVIEGQSTLVFPGLTKKSNVHYYGESDYVLPSELARVSLLLFDKNGNELHRYEVNHSSVRAVKRHEKKHSPLSPYRERRRFAFLYNPTFRLFAIVIGLTLLGASLFMGKNGKS